MTPRYRITDSPADLPRPSVTRLDTGTAVRLRGETLADVADALIEDVAGRRLPIATVLTLAVSLFGTAMRAVVDCEVEAARVQRFCEAAGRVE